MKDDTISRQAVLNLIEQSCCDLEYACDNVALRKEVEALPSAQPEIIRCKECIRYHEPSCLMAYDGKEWAEDNGFCHAGERRTDE